MVNMPDAYYGHPVGSDGVFEETHDRKRIIDHSCGTWYYGHDAMKGGSNFPWMRERETVDRTHNDVHRMVVVNGIWEFSA